MVGSSAVNPKTHLQGLKILVIDDSKTIRRTAETLLAKEGCEVFTAVDATGWTGDHEAFAWDDVRDALHTLLGAGLIVRDRAAP